jgi:hypothetical protein
MGKTDQKSGYIYTYWNPGNFGKVKIGFTAAGTVEKRLAKWRSAGCGHGVENLGSRGPTRKVPHVYRIEGLVFAELRDFRLKERDCPCGKTHIEWFAQTHEHIVKVIEKWENFMTSEERYGPGIGGRFLRENLSDLDFEELCRPIATEKLVPSVLSRPLQLRRSERLRSRRREGLTHR